MTTGTSGERQSWRQRVGTEKGGDRERWRRRKVETRAREREVGQWR